VRFSTGRIEHAYTEPNIVVKRLLVTGRHGFVGSTLAQMIAGDEALRDWNLVDMPEAVDVRDEAAMASLIDAARPDAVIHLAAQSFVPDAFRDPRTTLQVNVMGTLNLLQALQHGRFAGRLIYVSTGDVYGRVGVDALPVAETRAAAPRNPYAVSKLAAEALCRQWWMTEGIDAVVVRPFNHIGKGQGDRFVVSDFAHQVALIKHGRRPPRVSVGDIDVTRDFCDARDVVHAYFALLERGCAGEIYNVCSGREHSIRFILERLASLAGVEVSLEQETGRFRKSEQRRMRGDPSKIAAAAGWQATTPLDATLAGMLEHWESEVDA
jgi:GDP-4-dehydro-6-deoxy-D-mannose reductase